MLKRLLPFALVLLAACAGRAPPAPAPESTPVVISESEPPTPAATEPAPPPPDRPPPPDQPPPPAGRTGQTDTGRFRISIASVETAEAAAVWVRRAEAAGYRTELLAVEIDGKPWQRVLLPGYASLADAQAALPSIQQDLGVAGAWVTSRRRAPVPGDAPAEAAPPPPAPEQPAN